MCLVTRFLSSVVVAVRGPNLPPPDESRVASCVAVSPGAPTHVLLDDEVAEHIPGCNMAFRRNALDAIGGVGRRITTVGHELNLLFPLQMKVWTIKRNPVDVRVH